ncbi:DUF424 family protein [Candidatus Woesearchaeota archaeon]|nr:DUF424 family protein [Candidatus Woesearchaeota archaeon]
MRSETFAVAQHNSQGRLILAVCDRDVYGKKFEEGDAVLDLGSKFYAGEEKGADAVEKLMLHAYMIHAAGKNSVGIAIRLGLAAAENVKKVNGVQHVQVLMTA